MIWTAAVAIGWLCVCPSQAQTAKGHRLPNVAVGIHHHHPDSTLCSPLNIGLLSEADTLHGFQYGVFLGTVRGHADGVMLATLANALPQSPYLHDDRCRLAFPGTRRGLLG